jgi:WD40 repeat protein
MAPPWPETRLPPVDQNLGKATAFSPCGHYLACTTISLIGIPATVRILDRRDGQQVPLTGGFGNNRTLLCLSFSGDGKYLAAGGNDGLIRIWSTNSSRKPTSQGLKTLPDHPTEFVHCLAFASDSNRLASGSRNEIKLWNVEDGVCIHSLNHQNGNTDSLVFSGVGESIQRLAATTDGSLIHISWNSTLSHSTSDLTGDGAMARIWNTCFSRCGSFSQHLTLRMNYVCTK